jgi:hypothetical protein
VGLPTRSQENKAQLARVETALAHIRIGAERAGSTAQSLLISFSYRNFDGCKRSRGIFMPGVGSALILF